MADFAPDNISEPIILPLLLSFFGMLFFFLSRSQDVTKGRVRVWRWFAMIPVFIALFSGYKYFGAMFGAKYPWQLIAGADVVAKQVFRDTLFGLRMTLAIWGGFMIPFLSILLAVVLTYFDRRRVSRSQPGARVQA